jgi:hypothetical protein
MDPGGFELFLSFAVPVIHVIHRGVVSIAAYIPDISPRSFVESVVQDEICPSGRR